MPLKRNLYSSWRKTASDASLLREVCGGFLLLGLIALSSPSFSQEPPTASPNAPAPTDIQPADVIILVHPLTAEKTRIAVVYKKIVPHAQVKSEVGRLLAMTGWELATDLPIQDARVNPDYPKTTGTMFTLQKAPQLQKGVPALRPYLKAWQALSTLEVMFALPEAQASPNVERYENKAFVAELHKSLGVYRYEVTLKDHQGELPELGTSVSLPPTSTNQESSPSETKPNIKQEPSRSTSNLPVLLIVMGGILCIGAATYMSLSRRSPRNSPPPTIRR